MTNFFNLENIDSTSKLPIFYFDYSETESYPEKPEDLDFKKLKQMTNTFKKLGKYILILGDKDSKEKEKFCTKTANLCHFYQNRHANSWKDMKQDEKGNIITNDMLYMWFFNNQSESDVLWWKPLLPLHESFIPDDYETTLKNFSNSDTTSNSNP